MLIPKNQIAMFSIHSDPLVCLGSQEAGGQNIYIRHLCSELDKLGWEVDVFTRWDDPRKKRVSHISRNARVIRLRSEKTGYLAKNELFLCLPEIYKNFLKFIKSRNPYSLFHGHYWDGGWMALKARQQFSKPLIENFHSLGIVRMETRKKYAKNGEENEYFVNRLNAENEIIKNSSVVICLAETEKIALNQFYGCPLEKIVVIPGGADIKRWRPIEKEKARAIVNFANDNFVLLYIGRLEWRKGIGTLISAGSLLKQGIPRLKIAIVGGQIYGRQKNPEDFKEYKRLQKIAKEEKVEEITRFIGRIPNRKLPAFYSAADILVIPSYYEPFGLVALEGMASKIPIVASRIGGLSSTVKDNETGLLFSPHNAKDLKEKILLFYHSKELANRVVENAYKDIAENYSWQKMVGQISDIYKSLINQNENSSNRSI